MSHCETENKKRKKEQEEEEEQEESKAKAKAETYYAVTLLCEAQEDVEVFIASRTDLLEAIRKALPQKEKCHNKDLDQYQVDRDEEDEEDEEKSDEELCTELIAKTGLITSLTGTYDKTYSNTRFSVGYALGNLMRHKTLVDKKNLLFY
jgi:recombination DNA repair RAD52 pathway protein